MKKGLYLLYLIIIAVPIFLVITLITALSTIIGCFLGNSNFWGYYPGHWWSKLTCMLFLIKVDVRRLADLEPGCSYVFTANHQGAFDIFLIYGYLRYNFKWVMKASLRKLPFVGAACQAAGFIFVSAGKGKERYKTIQQAEKILKKGVSVVIFPEGSRTPDGKVHAFKRGAFQLAEDLNLPIVPMTIEGSYGIMPIHHYVPCFGRLTLTIHPPLILDTDLPADEAMRKAMQQTRKTILSVLPVEEQ